MALQENDRIFLSLASASANYTKPDAVIAAFAKWLDGSFRNLHA